MAEQYVWTSPSGDSLNLSDLSAGYAVTRSGTFGMRAPVYTVTSDNLAGIDGATVQNIRAEPRVPTLGLFVDATSATDFRAKFRGLVRAMRPKAGLGALTVSNETGESRTLNCYCTGGLEGDQIMSVGSFVAVLKFFAPDPWWYGAQQTVSVGLAAGTNFFPIFPLVLSPSTVQGQFDVDLSDADAPTYPVWTITGPGSALVLTNQTTGRSIAVTASLSAGQSLIIDTRPGYQSVRRDDGTNLMGSVTSDPALWPLIEGVNTVTAALTGATSASRIATTFRPRYSGI